MQWSGQTWGSTFVPLTQAGQLTVDPTADIVIDLRARLDTGGMETVTLRNFTVVRYPAQANP